MPIVIKMMRMLYSPPQARPFSIETIELTKTYYQMDVLGRCG